MSRTLWQRGRRYPWLVGLVLLTLGAAVLGIWENENSARSVVISTPKTTGSLGAGSASQASPGTSAAALPPAPTPGLSISESSTGTVHSGSIEKTIETTFATAISLNYNLGAPTMLANPGMDQPSPPQLVTIKSIGESDISQLFEPGSGSDWMMKGLAHAVDAQAQSNFRFVGGGVSHINFTDVTVTGTVATAAGAVTAWSQFSVLNGGHWRHVKPESTDVWSMTLDNVSDVWKVRKLDITSMSPR